jgi:enoyl-CoA hydratase/carnithine racemase
MTIHPSLLAGNRRDLAGHRTEHVLWQVADGVGTITLNRPERKNPLTFDSYAELRDLFQALRHAGDVKVVLVHGAGDNFCSGGDVHDIIGPLTELKAPELLMFTRMTGDLVKAMRHCPQPVIAAIDGVCAGAGAIIAMASDLRYGTARSKTAFLFNRVGLAGCDMGACNLLPRIVGHGRASELLYTGRALAGDEAFIWGFFNRLCAPEAVLDEARALAAEIVAAAPLATRAVKATLAATEQLTVEQAFGALRDGSIPAYDRAMASADAEEGPRAFAEGREPVWRGE